MSHVESIRKLFRHMEWADALVWSAVLRCGDAGNDSIVIERLRHTHTVQHAFLRAWKEQEHISNAGGSLTLNELMPWARDFHNSARDYLASMSEETLEKP